ncbi:MAG: cytochrome C [Candidatus Methanoperedens sp.]|nr:cytochrome C [Candidatus Methanoperedens sp.]MCZ7361412.1 cytochrome C [Candidatus Methanoperedens sp.]HLB69757.1 cytochrome c peroxidase [Candidatus Methanoperedens sp.]
MSSKGIWICVAVALLAASAGIAAALSDEEKLGKKLFFDSDLSEPRGQSCADCHGIEVGFTGPESDTNAHGAVYEGAVPGRFGNRKPPTTAYAGDSPVLHMDEEVWMGGMFWDGRATGWTLGDPLAEQAQGPFLNPLEQNNPSEKAVIDKVMSSSYSDLFKKVCGDKNNDYYDCIGRTIAAYERSKEVSPFSSKYDYYLEGKAKLTEQEKKGLDLFKGKGKCDKCHVIEGSKPVFTDFTYDNLGVPRNPENPFYNMAEFNPLGAAWVDAGLGEFLATMKDYRKFSRDNYGKQKVPTLRNVDKRPAPDFVKAYAHNGYFKSLKEIVHFYNTRDILPVCGFEGSVPGKNCWPLPELALNMNTEELGDLGLSDKEESAIVAFMMTLSDGYRPEKSEK